MQDRSIFDSDWLEVDGNMVHRTAIIYPNVSMGTGNYVGPFCVIGGNGEMRGVDQKAFRGRVVIGNDNVISELVTIQAPFESDSSTNIGSGNIIMAHVHIGHDAKIGDNTEICTHTTIGGYAHVKDGAKIKLNCTIRNRGVIGEGSVVGMGSNVVKEVERGQVVMGNPARPKE